jgi:hypothetical protein
VLSAWQSGLGKVAVYMSDMGSAWSADFAAWSGSARLWSQVVRWLHRQVDDRALTARLAETSEGARLIVESEDPDGRFNSHVSVHATVRPPEGEPFDVALEPTTPGKYEAALPMGPNGPYAVSITASSADPGVAEQRMLRGFYWTGEREQRGCADGGTTLQRIAQMTGGRILDGGDSPFNGPRIASDRDVSTWLAGLALMLFFLELTGPLARALARYGWRRRVRPDAAAERHAA